MFKNLLSNIIGKIWNLLSIIIFIPLYIRFLGFESYSIISFSILLYAIITILDAGLSASLSREMARADLDSDSDLKLKTFDTLKTTYLFICFSIVLVTFIFSNEIATEFIKTDKFSNDILTFYVRIIAFGVGFQMFFRFLIAGIIGLNKHVLANKILIYWSVLRNGFVLLLIYYYPQLDLFFMWQAMTTVLFSIIALYHLTVSVKGAFGFNLSFDLYQFKRIWRFTVSMFIITILAVLSQQLDKLILSNLLPIDQLGYYSIAFTLSLFLVSFTSPIAVTILPKLTALFSINNNKEAISLFNIFQKISLIIIFSMAINYLFFPYDILYAWIGDEEIAKVVSSYLPIITLGYTFMAISVMPFNIAIANGYTKLNIRLGLVSIIISAPGYFLLIKNYGVEGAAYVFCLAQLIYILPFYYVINKKFLKLKFIDLVLKPIIRPLIICIVVVCLFKYFKYYLLDDRLFNLLYVFCSIGTCLIICSLCSFKLYQFKSVYKEILKSF